MFFRSTGLGKTELKGHIDDLQRQGDFIIMYVDVVDPVKWRIRAAMSFSDLAKALSCMAKFTILRLVTSPRQWMNKNPQHPGDF